MKLSSIHRARYGLPAVLAVLFLLGATPGLTAGPEPAPKQLRAAEKGNVAAQLALAKFYRAQNDFPSAVIWLKKASRAGDSEAKFMLAEAFYKGEGVEKNDVEAARLLRQLADKGNPSAQYRLAIMYLRGEGVPRSDVEAAAWYELAIKRYKPGPGRDAAIAEYDALRAKISPAEKEKAVALAQRRFNTFVKSAAVPPLPPDQTQGGKLVTVPGQPDNKPGLSGSLQAGIRWQSDANGAASSYLNNPNPSASVLPIRDWNSFALGKMTWLAGGGGRFSNIQSDVTLYKTYQHNDDVTSLTYAELSVGPNIALTADEKNVLRPYVTGDFLETDNSLYNMTAGPGLSYKRLLSADTAVLTSVEETWSDYRDQGAAVNNSDLSGRMTEISGRYIQRLAPWLTGNLSLTWYGYTAHQNWYSYNSIVASNGYAVKVPSPLKNLRQPVTFYGSVSYQHRDYDAPNPPVSPTISRTDNEWQGALSMVFPLTEQWALSPTVQRTARSSSLPDYQYRNTVTSLAAVFRF